VYVIVVYDVAVERLDTVRKVLKQYLNWVQNSAFEGELTEGKFEELAMNVRDAIDERVDSVLCYYLSNAKWLDKKVIGIEKSEVTYVL
jgi:CRISPR-associated protein Cas2